MADVSDVATASSNELKARQFIRRQTAFDHNIRFSGPSFRHQNSRFQQPSTPAGINAGTPDRRAEKVRQTVLSNRTFSDSSILMTDSTNAFDAGPLKVCLSYLYINKPFRLPLRSLDFNETFSASVSRFPSVCQWPDADGRHLAQGVLIK